MTRTEFEREIEDIRFRLLEMAGLVKDAMRVALDALRDNDMTASQQVLQNDTHINRKRFELEAIIIAVIATQGPVAHDLRMLTAALDLCTELERMGDYAKGLASINISAGGLSLPKILTDLHFMGGKVTDMLSRAIHAYMNEDTRAAGIIAKEDDLIDGLYKQVYYEAMDIVIDDARNVERVNLVLWAAHHIERFADRVTNICERTIFISTGELHELHLREHDFPQNPA
jgi:phosphate transport system protein